MKRALALLAVTALAPGLGGCVAAIPPPRQVGVGADQYRLVTVVVQRGDEVAEVLAGGLDRR